MAVYTVHQPPLKKYESASDPDRLSDAQPPIAVEVAK